MASKSSAFSEMSERCDSCQHETPHSISVELKTESSESENSEFSREPYRVSECTVCGEQTTQRMNNA